MALTDDTGGLSARSRVGPSSSRQIVTYGVADGALAALGVLTTPLLTRLLDTSQYGTRELIASVVLVLTPILLFGLDSALPSRYAGIRDEPMRRSFAATNLAALIVWSSAVTLAIGAFAPAGLVGLLGGPDSVTPLRIGIVGVIPVLVVAFAKYVLRFEFAVTQFALLSVCSAVLVVGGGLLALMILRDGLVAFYCGQLVGGIAAGALAIWFIRRWLGGPLDMRHVASAAATGVAFVPGTLASLALAFSDRQLLGILADPAAVGTYAVGSRVAAIPALLHSVINTAWVPVAARAHHSGRPLAGLFTAATVRAVAAIGTVGVILTAFAPDLVSFAAPPTFASARGVVAPLMVSAVLIAAGQVAMAALFLARRPGIGLALNLAALAIVSALSLLLIPHFGITGAALAIAGGQAFVAAGYLVAAPRVLLGTSVDLRRAAPAVMVSLGGIALAAQLQAGDGIPALLARLILVVASAVMLGIIAGVPDLRRWRAALG